MARRDARRRSDIGAFGRRRFPHAAVLSLVVLLGSAAGDSFGEARPRASEPEGRSATVSIPVEGMSCGSCAASIKRATKAIEGVRDVHVDLVGRRARVEYDDAIASLEKIRTAIEELGYKTGTPVVEGR